MKTIYLDHNVISSVGGIPATKDAERQRNHAADLRKCGYRFALSAWNMYELARSNDIKHIEQCCDFVDELDPVWVNNNFSVKAQEIDRYLAIEFDRIGPVRSRPVVPFSMTVSDMWSSYRLPSHAGDTFRASVLGFHRSPKNMREIERVANEMPDAILVARRAQQLGTLDFFDSIVDRQYFATMAPRSAPPEQINFLLKTKRALLAASPAIAVEDALTERRLQDSFTPKPNDAADLQHSIASLAYCDYFVTGDKKLYEHCRTTVKQAGVACQLYKSMLEITSKFV
ncbi:hypothetical protein [Collimonas humicola]|uniref:hypothetical protein n=1 Tax=Collimonas humicola TaxID=2825886 RepID=UPI001B8B74E1|nr:hypothetical protein [Collimonas humicola]